MLNIPLSLLFITSSFCSKPEQIITSPLRKGEKTWRWYTGPPKPKPGPWTAPIAPVVRRALAAFDSYVEPFYKMKGALDRFDNDYFMIPSDELEHTCMDDEEGMLQLNIQSIKSSCLKCDRDALVFRLNQFKSHAIKTFGPLLQLFRQYYFHAFTRSRYYARSETLLQQRLVHKRLIAYAHIRLYLADHLLLKMAEDEKENKRRELINQVVEIKREGASCKLGAEETEYFVGSDHQVVER